MPWGESSNNLGAGLPQVMGTVIIAQRFASFVVCVCWCCGVPKNLGPEIHSNREGGMMKRLTLSILVTAVLAAVLVGCSSSEETTTTESESATGTEETEQAVEASVAPSVMASPAVQALGEDIEVVLVGAGFEPGQELRFLVTTNQEGLEAVSDLTYDSDPEPVANSEGAFVTAWAAMGRLADKGVITEGVYSVVVADTENNPLATVAVAFYDSEKPAEEQPAWANPSLTE